MSEKEMESIRIGGFGLAKRFWQKADVKDNADECWQWRAAVVGKQREYGGISAGSKKDKTAQILRAPRVAFYLSRGYMPAVVAHTCFNKRCINPWHLRGDPDNRNNVRDSDNNVTKLDVALVKEIRAKYATGKVSQRQLAREYGVTQPNIGYVTRGDTWN